MLGLSDVFDGLMNWMATNARSFSYLLPDALEVALYLCLATYFATQFANQHTQSLTRRSEGNFINYPND